MDENGRVAFNTAGIDVSSDGGLTLLNNIVNGGDKYLFQVLNPGEKVSGINLSDNKASSLDPNENFYGILHYSVTSINPYSPVGTMPTDGYKGSVSLGSGSWTFPDGTPQPTSNIVFHELSENYYMTTRNMPYATDVNLQTGFQSGGAHEQAILDANNFSKQVGPAGSGRYVRPQ